MELRTFPSSSSKLDLSRWSTSFGTISKETSYLISMYGTFFEQLSERARVYLGIRVKRAKGKIVFRSIVTHVQIGDFRKGKAITRDLR